MGNMDQGMYLYCVVEERVEKNFVEVGLDDNKVYAIPFRDVSVIAHSCKAEAYNSSDDKRVKDWILRHNRIVDEMLEKYGSVLPFSFDTIIKGGKDDVNSWLEKDYSKIKSKLALVRGKREHGVQIFIDKKRVSSVINENDEIRDLRNRIGKMQEGTSFMFQKKLDSKIREITNHYIQKLSDKFCEEMTDTADSLKIEKNKEMDDDRIMVINASVLLRSSNEEKFRTTLDNIDQKDGVSVRFVGPFAPYSFSTYE